MQILKVSEATAARRRIPVLLVDATDGYTPETGLVATATITVSENGAAFAAAAGSLVEVGNGLYYYQAALAEVDTLGALVIRVVDAAARTFIGVAQVVAFDPYDAAAQGMTNLDAAVSTRATAAAVAGVQADTDDIQARLPAALVGGRMDASVGAMAANVVTAAAIATNAIDADAVAADAVTKLQSGLATAANLALVPAAVDTQLSGTHGGGTWVDSGAPPSAAAIATQVDTTLTSSHGAGAWGGSGGATAADIADAVWDEARAGHGTAGTFGGDLGAVPATLATLATAAAVAALPTAAGIASAVWSSVLEGAFTATQLVRLIASAAVGNATGLDTGTVRFRDLGNTKDRIVATVSAAARTVTTRDGA